MFSSEIDAEHRLNEQLIKDMTGGDTMEARRLYREAFTFKPTFKLWMYGNHKPEIRGTDDALWGRVKLVEFNVSFADRVDLDLPKNLRAELSGILNWAIDGCLAWKKGGLRPPAKVQAATEKYREEQDDLGQFIHECCQIGEDYYQCKASLLYTEYRRWAEENGQVVLSQKRLGSYLTVHGYPSDDNATGRGILRKRIALIARPEDQEKADDHPANHHHERLTRTISSNGAAKPHSTPSDANLANHGSNKFFITDTHKGFSGSNLSKVSNRAVDASYHVENSGDSGTNLQTAKVSTPDEKSAESSPTPSPPCPHCGQPKLKAFKGDILLCHSCGKQVATPKEATHVTRTV